MEEMDMSSFAHLSDEDAALFLELLQQDGEEIVSAAIGKGKKPEGTMTNFEVAFNLFKEAFPDIQTFLTDRRMTRSMQSAVQLDGDALLQSQNEERIAEQDRNLSVSLSKGERQPPVPQITSPTSVHEEELLEKMACIYVTGIDDAESDDDTVTASQPESSAWAASRPAGKARQKRECAACGDQKHFAALSRAPCEHEYCRQCLSHLFRDAIVDESLFPPRCCKKPIPLDKSQIFLDANVVRQFRQKAVELSTPNRTYCHSTSCTVFIPPSNYSDTTATCGECGEKTCITCKEIWHEGDCPKDEQLQQVIQLAREEGWQRCQNCWSMVELNLGCHHMTCRCGFQFCYVCGARWKSCGCEHWVEHRLLERAAQIDARDHVDERGRHQRIQAIAQDLRVNHECDHDRWRGRRGPEECEECHRTMPEFIYQCRQCHILACRRCRYHRL